MFLNSLGLYSSPTPIPNSINNNSEQVSTISTSTNSIEPTSGAPSDFSFDFKFHPYEINTSTVIISEYQGENVPESTASYVLSKAQMNQVYQEMVKLGVFTNPNIEKPVVSTVIITGGCSDDTLLIKANSMVKKPAWSHCNELNNTLQTLSNFMENLLAPIMQNNLPRYTGPMYQ